MKTQNFLPKSQCLAKLLLFVLLASGLFACKRQPDDPLIIPPKFSELPEINSQKAAKK